MSKATVTRLFIGGLIAFGAGAIVAMLAIALAIANDVFVMAGTDIAAIQGGALAWALIVIAILGGLAAAGGVVAGFVAWIGAVLNTWQLESKAWFVGLVLLGDLQLRLRRDDRLRHRRSRRQGRGRGPGDAGADRRLTLHRRRSTGPAGRSCGARRRVDDPARPP